MTTRKIFFITLLMLVSFALATVAGCGGGGGMATTSPPPSIEDPVWVYGRAEWEDGTPAIGLEVFYSIDGSEFYSTQTDSNGDFAFKVPKKCEILIEIWKDLTRFYQETYQIGEEDLQIKAGLNPDPEPTPTISPSPSPSPTATPNEVPITSTPEGARIVVNEEYVGISPNVITLRHGDEVRAYVNGAWPKSVIYNESSGSTVISFVFDELVNSTTAITTDTGINDPGHPACSDDGIIAVPNAGDNKINLFDSYFYSKGEVIGSTVNIAAYSRENWFFNFGVSVSTNDITEFDSTGNNKTVTNDDVICVDISGTSTHLITLSDKGGKYQIAFQDYSTGVESYEYDLDGDARSIACEDDRLIISHSGSVTIWEATSNGSSIYPKGNLEIPGGWSNPGGVDISYNGYVAVRNYYSNDYVGIEIFDDWNQFVSEILIPKTTANVYGVCFDRRIDPDGRPDIYATGSNNKLIKIILN